MELRKVHINRSVETSPASIAITIFGMVLLLPILLLLLFAGIVAIAAFAILSVFAWLFGKIRGLSSKDSEGRKNVRIRRSPPNEDESNSRF
ncbi:hypothetical protein H8D29_03075 [PVC group bacterium]|jgi:hypothetical protein|nr:hypothetical protein [PVC group bacterium]